NNEKVDFQDHPNWIPQVFPKSKVLVVGANGGIGKAVIDMLLQGPSCIIGYHHSNKSSKIPESTEQHRIIDLCYSLKNDTDCHKLVDSFNSKAKGIDNLVVLSGGISRHAHFKELSGDDWEADIQLNLNIPFYLARRALNHMHHGSIVLLGTESALHGGGSTSLAYSTAKRGIECLVQGLSREGAKNDTLVNGVRPGFIQSGFHQRWQGYDMEKLKQRADLIPLKRAGTPKEVSALIIYLLSGWSRFITGQMFSITGGDWL
ncbi:MAG: SDR family oxidoreductase, partial [Bacteroidetes bacterium]|nr:SDR family oxidoreductase [Bacteroidota bacterium]